VHGSACIFLVIQLWMTLIQIITTDGIHEVHLQFLLLFPNFLLSLIDAPARSLLYFFM
jgi:hypothetical protein